MAPIEQALERTGAELVPIDSEAIRHQEQVGFRAQLAGVGAIGSTRARLTAVFEIDYAAQGRPCQCRARFVSRCPREDDAFCQPDTVHCPLAIFLREQHFTV